MLKEISPRYGLRLINTGPAVIATCGPVQSPNGIALAWCMPVSHNPAMVGISVAPQRYSHDLIRDGSCFCVNVPSVIQLDELMYMGTHSGRNGDKFAPSGLTPAPADSVDTVYIEECPGHIQCSLEQSHTAGDHTVFIGRIVKAMVDDALFEHNKWNLSSDSGRTIHHLGEEFFGVLQRIEKYRKNV